jgi:hypothetical protein
MEKTEIMTMKISTPTECARPTKFAIISRATPICFETLKRREAENV